MNLSYRRRNQNTDKKYNELKDVITEHVQTEGKKLIYRNGRQYGELKREVRPVRMTADC